MEASYVIQHCIFGLLAGNSRMSGNPDVRKSGSPDIQLSQYADFRIILVSVSGVNPGQRNKRETAIRLMAKFSEHKTPGIETGKGTGLSKMTEE